MINLVKDLMNALYELIGSNYGKDGSYRKLQITFSKEAYMELLSDKNESMYITVSKDRIVKWNGYPIIMDENQTEPFKILEI